MSVPSCLDKYQSQIIADMHEFLDGSDRPHVQMIYYHLGWLDKSFKSVDLSPGKLSRPSIALLVAETLGGNVSETLPAATAVQLFHDFTLMHDDIEDGDPFRRHRETVWNLWGVPRAVNAGDAMYTYSLQAILRVTKNREELLSYLLNIFQEIVYGQELDLSFVYLPVSEVSVDDYLRMISGKSAALIGASAKVGAIMSDATTEVQDKFYNFGFNLGIAYQVFDDFVSIWGNKDASGKLEHIDLVDKKKTLPVLMLFEAVNEPDRELLQQLYNEEILSQGSVAKVLELLDKYNIKPLIEERLRSYKLKSLEALRELSLESQAEADFTEIVAWLLPGVEV